MGRRCINVIQMFCVDWDPGTSLVATFTSHGKNRSRTDPECAGYRQCHLSATRTHWSVAGLHRPDKQTIHNPLCLYAEYIYADPHTYDNLSQLKWRHLSIDRSDVDQSLFAPDFERRSRRLSIISVASVMYEIIQCLSLSDYARLVGYITRFLGGIYTKVFTG